MSSASRGSSSSTKVAGVKAQRRRPPGPTAPPCMRLMRSSSAAAALKAGGQKGWKAGLQAPFCRRVGVCEMGRKAAAQAEHIKPPSRLASTNHRIPASDSVTRLGLDEVQQERVAARRARRLQQQPCHGGVALRSRRAQAGGRRLNPSRLGRAGQPARRRIRGRATGCLCCLCSFRPVRRPRTHPPSPCSRQSAAHSRAGCPARECESPPGCQADPGPCTPTPR